jgi:hypothetical protein
MEDQKRRNHELVRNTDLEIDQRLGEGIEHAGVGA